MHTKFFSRLACTKETGMEPNRACSRALMSCVACIFAFYKRAKRKRRRWTDDSIYFFRRCMFPLSSFFFFCEQLCGSYATQGYERMKWWQSVQFHPTNLCSFTSISAIQTIEEDREPIPENKKSCHTVLGTTSLSDSWSTSLTSNCARANAIDKFQTYKVIILFQAKLWLHNYIQKKLHHDIRTSCPHQNIQQS